MVELHNCSTPCCDTHPKGDDLQTDEQHLITTHGWPAVLTKACNDNPWFYAIGLRSGSRVQFAGATASCDGVWVTLHDISAFDPVLDMEMRRGMMVRVSDIMWAIDGGH